MHLLTEQTVDIQCPADALYVFVGNMENFARWFPEVLGIRAEDASPHGSVGKVYLEQVRLPSGRIRTIPIRVVAAQAPHRFATEGQFAPLLPRMVVTIEALSPNSSRLHWCMYSRNDSLIFRFTLLPLIRRVMRRRAAAGMKNIKDLMETAHTVAMESNPC